MSLKNKKLIDEYNLKVNKLKPVFSFKRNYN